MPLGIFAARRPRLSAPLVGAANLVQTMPSLAMFGFLLPLPLLGGVGPRTAIVVLILYGLLPIVRTTIAGLQGIDRVDPRGRHRDGDDRAASCCGRSSCRWRCRRSSPASASPPSSASARRRSPPRSAPAASASTSIAACRWWTATVILAGAIPAAALALVVDAGLLWLERRLAPRRRASRRALAAAAAAAAIAAGAARLGGGRSPSRRTAIVVGSKNFTEQLILGEIVAQTIERETGLPVDRRLNLGGTLICERALASGDIDVYVEYTGTALTAVFHQPLASDTAAVLQTVRDAYARTGRTLLAAARIQQHVHHPGARRATRATLDLRTIDDAAAHGAAVARRLRLRVPGAARRLSRAVEEVRAALRRAAAGDGPDADLPRARVRAGRSRLPATRPPG